MASKKYIAVSELISLTDKRAIVTGGAMGIGFAISYRLAEAGATIFIVDKNPEEGQKASQELRGYGYQATSVQCDVSREEEVQDMVNAAVREMGAISVFPFTTFAQARDAKA